MAAMSIAQIAAAIEQSPTLLAMADAGETQRIADALNAAGGPVVSTVLTTQQVIDQYPDGPIAAETLLLKIEAARDTMLANASEAVRTLGSLLRRQLVFMNAQGADFGGAALRLVFDQMASRGALTAAEVTALKGFARPDVVTHTRVGEALKLLQRGA